MARQVSNAIPATIGPLFAGTDLAAREGLTFLLLTATEEGWPHLAMLSVGEVLARSPRLLRLALWPASTACANLARTGRATLALVHQGVGYALRCSAQDRGELLLADGTRLAAFDLRVEQAFEDAVPYAELTSGVTYRLTDPGAVLPRWRETIAALAGK